MRLSRSLLFVIAGFAVGFGVLGLTFKAFTRSQIEVGCRSLSETGDFDPSQTVALWQNQLLTPPSFLASALTQDQAKVLGETATDKWIEIDLKKQKIIAHQGDSVFLESPISSGLWNKTPTGTYNIWYKVRSTKMEGGIRGTKSYYYLPNVPYAMFFYGDYGIHGTYWHTNFGNPMSHGCVNSPTPVAEKLFYWSDPQLPSGKSAVRSTPENPGTKIVIHD